MKLNEEMKDILAECYTNTELFCKVFFPNIFYRPFSSLHHEIFKILDDESLQRVVIAAPRGFGKSSILSLAYPAKKVLYQAKKYIIPISASSDMAIEQSENLKNELLVNEEVNKLFGSIKSKDGFSKEEWITSSGIKIKPRGAGQQIRGRRYGIWRPDLILLDDVEDDEAVMSEDQRNKLKNWFFSAVCNSVDRGSKDWRIIVMGTLLHQNSLLADLLNDPAWYGVRLEICDNNYKSNWPDFMSDEAVHELAESYRQQDMLDVFYREYRNIPIAIEEQGFKPNYFSYYTEKESDLNLDHNIVTAILADPAKTHTKGSANTAIMGVSVNLKEGWWLVRDIVEGQFYPDQLYKEMLDMAERLNAMVLAPEVTSLNEYITQPLKNEMRRRGKFYVIVEVKPREGKTGPRRSGALVPLYRQRMIKHNKNICGGLERYLLEWPRPSKWDVIDCLSGMIFVLEDGKKYFEPPESKDVEEDYKSLYKQYDEPIEFGMRI